MAVLLLWLGSKCLGMSGTLTDNFWDLRSRHVFEQVHLDMIDAYSDDEFEEDEEEKKLIQEELGETIEESDELTDDIDFDKPVKNADDDDEL